MTPRDTVQQRIRGLYAIADASLSPDVESAARALVAGGARLLQVRCKGWPEDDVLRVVRALVPACRAAGCTLIVNDHPAVAAAADADGVHVGPTDGAASEVRAIVGPDRIVGRSTGAADHPHPELDADYLAFGPVFPTPRLSRPKEVVGLRGLVRARAVVVGRPLVAIGGITADNLALVRATGVDAWAVIGALAGGDVAERVRALS